MFSPQNVEEYKEIKNENKVLFFSATWCPPCKMIKPYFKELSENKHFEDIAFVYIDTDKLNLAEYKFNSIPTFVTIYKNEKVNQFSGASRHGLRLKLDTLRKKIFSTDKQ